MEWSCGGEQALMEAGEGVWCWKIGQREGVTGSLERFGFSSRSVFVLWMVIHVFGSNTFSFVDEWPLLDFCQQFPLRTKPFGDL